MKMSQRALARMPFFREDLLEFFVDEQSGAYVITTGRPRTRPHLPAFGSAIQISDFRADFF
jgi:hypothetical protein